MLLFGSVDRCCGVRVFVGVGCSGLVCLVAVVCVLVFVGVGCFVFVLRCCCVVSCVVACFVVFFSSVTCLCLLL